MILSYQVRVMITIDLTEHTTEGVENLTHQPISNRRPKPININNNNISTLYHFTSSKYFSKNKIDALSLNSTRQKKLTDYNFKIL